MKNIRSYFALGALLILLNSCVYSLFPIYTEETLVFIPELLGRWQLTDEEEDYIEFRPLSADEGIEIKSDGAGNKFAAEEYTDSITVNGMTIRFNTNEGMMINSRMVYDRDSIRMFYEKLAKGVGPIDEKEVRDPTTKEESNALEALGKSLDALGKTMDAVTKVGQQTSSFKGTMYESNEKSYRVIVKDGDEVTEYIGHIAKIGDEHFLDIYPLAEYSDSGFGSNMMPVHTFLKLSVKVGELNLTYFDLDKLNRLFESNLIRLRHENVDGTVLITAQPQEIQKFLDRYSDDETVFEETEIYQKAD